MSKPKVIVTRRWPEEVEEKLEEHFEVHLNREDKPMSADRLKAALGQADALFPTVTDKIDAEVIAAEPLRAKLIGNFGVGYNHIDTEAAKARGLVVTNTPEVLTDATADLAMTLLFSTARRAGEGERHVRAGDWTGWRPTHMLGTQVTGKTLGVIGFGRIGRAMAIRAHKGFGMKILAYDDRTRRGGLRQRGGGIGAGGFRIAALPGHAGKLSPHESGTPRLHETRRTADQHGTRRRG